MTFDPGPPPPRIATGAQDVQHPADGRKETVLAVDEKGAPGVALVTGANRGIGLEVCRQLAGRGMTVVLGARDPGEGKAAGDGLDFIPRRLDISEDESVRRLAAEMEEFGRLDVLLNNAGVNFDFTQRTTEVDLGMVHETFETNFFGAWRTCEAFLPLIRRSGHGRIVNVSSEAGPPLPPGGHKERRRCAPGLDDLQGGAERPHFEARYRPEGHRRPRQRGLPEPRRDLHHPRPARGPSR